MKGHPEASVLQALDRLAGEERRDVLEHVLTCRACRAELARLDPTALFGLLAFQPIPEDALERLSARVAAETATTTPARRSVRRWVAAASIAAALLLAAFLGTRVDGTRPGPIGEPRWTAAARPGMAPAVVEQDLPALPARGVELLSTPGEAEVVDFAIGEAQVVVIFDRELDI